MEGEEGKHGKGLGYETKEELSKTAYGRRMREGNVKGRGKDVKYKKKRKGMTEKIGRKDKY